MRRSWVSDAEIRVVWLGAPSAESRQLAALDWWFLVTMEEMFRLFVFLTCTVLGWAQSPANPSNKPPAEVDRALRSRITQFYQYEVDGKYRQAEALVAEDTKDLFYESAKPKYLSFEIQRIEYSDNYTHARVLTNCEQFIPVPELKDIPFKLGTISTWKLVDGQWYWYVDPQLVVQTPFGTVKLGPAQGGTVQPPAPINIPKAEDVLQTLVSQVKADKQSLNLKPGEAQQVAITNGAPGTISISLLGSLPGVDIKLDRLQMKAGEKALLTFRAGDVARPGMVSILVEQTNQVIPIQVNID